MDFSSSFKIGQANKYSAIFCFFLFVLPITTKNHDFVRSISEFIFEHAMFAYEQGDDEYAVRSFKAVCRIASGMSNPVGQQVWWPITKQNMHGVISLHPTHCPCPKCRLC